ncbi:hypothetical protein N7474_003519 [Penicillium riverlandense]|uniref:uncharacterized protein n=1 Tax=Penicillium riverlandense TaxID=1903569 RepID=UPI0025465F29|nr:uncharacterized protein N7474_003519 [Penicillium riverlandense]KAJ5826381.1 hypothetical protein N7474_003519 [Penicillium riverlandense]
MSPSDYSEKINGPHATERRVDSSSSLATLDQNQLASPVSDSTKLESQVPLPPPYHVFTRYRKLQMVCIVSLAAIFSPLSSNIYFPALGTISKDLGVPMSLTTLTVTVYMIIQGLAPSFWGSFSDILGRRGIFIGTFIVYIISNILLAVSTNYGELMAFRALQAAGSSATISIGAGVIGDITTSAERGEPGGDLWRRSIFWFLVIFSGLSLLILLFFLPETIRTVAGNGTVPLHGLYKPWIYYITGQRDVKEDAIPAGKKKKVTFKTVFAPLSFLIEKDVFITLFYGAIVYTVWSMVTSSTSALFESVYGLNSLEVGLTFLGNGFGCMSGSYTIGYLMDYNHKLTEREYCERRNLPLDTPINTKTHPDFPIEIARMRNTWWITALFIVCTAAYGFSLETSVAVPVILQYLIAYCATAIFTINSALVIDLYPGASASATAVNNLMRCEVGAAGVAAVQPIIDALTAKWAFLLLAGVTLHMVPLLLIEMRWGAGWRLERTERLKRKAESA